MEDRITIFVYEIMCPMQKEKHTAPHTEHGVLFEYICLRKERWLPFYQSNGRKGVLSSLLPAFITFVSVITPFVFVPIEILVPLKKVDFVI